MAHMKERAKQALRAFRVDDLKRMEKQWHEEGWEKLQSFFEVGLNPNTTLLSLFGDFGNKGAAYDKYMNRAGFSYQDRQRVWGIITLFQNDADYYCKHGEKLEDYPTIGDFIGIKSKQLEGLSKYSPIESRIIERLFANPRE